MNNVTSARRLMCTVELFLAPSLLCAAWPLLLSGVWGWVVRAGLNGVHVKVLIISCISQEERSFTFIKVSQLSGGRVEVGETHWLLRCTWPDHLLPSARPLTSIIQARPRQAGPGLSMSARVGLRQHCFKMRCANPGSLGLSLKYPCFQFPQDKEHQETVFRVTKLITFIAKGSSISDTLDAAALAVRFRRGELTLPAAATQISLG